MAAMELNEALARISLIREQMARTDVFRGFRSLTVGFSGMLAMLAGLLQAAWITDPRRQIGPYLVLWVGTAAISVAVCSTEILVRHWRFSSAASRQLTALTVGQFLPCIAAGALLTTAIFRHATDVVWMLPGLWAALFSLGIFATYRLLPRSVFWVAVYYLACGVLILCVGPEHALRPWTMAGTFGVGQVVAALLLYLNLERRDDDSQT